MHPYRLSLCLLFVLPLLLSTGSQAGPPLHDYSTTVETKPGRGPVTPLHTVLLLGDSHSMGHFGKSLHTQVQERFGVQVTLVAACGKSELGFIKGAYAQCGVIIRTPQNKVRIPKGCKKNPCGASDGARCSRRDCKPKPLEYYLKTLQPDLTVVQLGANSVWMGSEKRGWPTVRKNANQLVALLTKHDTQCVWITPPDVMLRSKETQDSFAAMYEEELEGSCAVFNSRPSNLPYLNYKRWVRELGISPKKHDQMHYGRLGAKGRELQEQWAADIVAFIEEKLGPFPKKQTESAH